MTLTLCSAGNSSAGPFQNPLFEKIKSFDLGDKSETFNAFYILDPTHISSDPKPFSSLKNIVSQRLREASLSAFGLKKTPQGSLLLLQGEENHNYDLTINGVRLCNYYLRAHQFLDGSVYVFGKMPTQYDADYALENLNGHASDIWPTPDLAFQNAIEFLEEQELPSQEFLASGNPTLFSSERCYYLEDQQPVPAWEITFGVGNMSYRAVSGENMAFSVQKLIFGLDGSTKVYDKNPVDGKLVDIGIEVESDGTLENKYFKTNPLDTERAKEENGVFNYETSDPKFSESLVFAHANRHMKWFMDLGFKWKDPGPIDLILHGEEEGSDIQVFYNPPGATTTKRPLVRICDGDGVRLQNLTLDADVVSHELGHHIIFQTVIQVTENSEALLLHEGLADYFLYARTGDACLGESICPKDSKYCWVPEKCLRTAENKMLYNDSDYEEYAKKKLYHLQSQVLSGFLWDLRSNNLVPADHLNNITLYTTLNLLGKESGFRDLIVGLMQADKALSNGKYACTIQNAAVKRQFGSFLEGIDCQSLSSASSNQRKTKKTGPFDFLGCSVIPGVSTPGNRNLFNPITLVLLCLPCLVVPFFTRRNNAKTL